MGGAGNVARQLRAYGAPVIEVELARCVKVRILAAMAGMPETEVLRLDYPWRIRRWRRGSPTPFIPEAHPPLGGVVYADYRGLTGPPPEVGALVRSLRCPKVVDVRRVPYGWDAFDVLKINQADGLLAESCRQDYERLGRKALMGAVVTRGSAGHVVVTGAGPVDVPAMELPGPVVNVSGAGDVFTATLVVAMASAYGRCGSYSAADIEPAARLAGLAAALRVRKPGYNVAVAPEELAPWLDSGPPKSPPTY